MFSDGREESRVFCRRGWEWVLRIAFLLVLALAFFRFSDFREAAKAYQGLFRQAGGNYDAIRMANTDTRAAMLARSWIPKDAPFDFSPQSNWSNIRVRYVMYPNTNCAKNWDYFIDLGHKIDRPDPAWQQVELMPGTMLYAKPNVPLIQALPESRPDRRFPAFFTAAFLELAAGFVLLSLLRISPESGGALWFLGAAYLLGFAALSGLIWIYLLLGMPLTISSIIAVSGFTIAALGLAALRPLLRNLQALCSWRSLRQCIPANIYGFFFLGFTLYLLWQFILPIVLSPVMSWDAQSHWIFKAKALFEHRSLAFSADAHNNEYPILWPVNIAVQFVLAGDTYDELAKWTAALLFLAFLTQIQGALSFLRVSAAWQWGLVPLYLVFFNEPSLSTAYAEVAFLGLMTGAIAALLATFEPGENARYFALALLFSAGVAVTKFEGGPTCFIMAVALGLAQARFPLSKRGWALMFLFAIPALLTVAWFFYQRTHGYLPREAHLRDPITLSKMKFLVDQVLDSVVGRGMGWRLFAGAGLFALLRWRTPWKPAETYLAAAAMGLLLFVVAGLAGWTMEHIKSETLTATPRLALHASPFLFIWLCFRLSAGIEAETPAGECSES